MFNDGKVLLQKSLVGKAGTVYEFNVTVSSYQNITCLGFSSHFPVFD